MNRFEDFLASLITLSIFAVGMTWMIILYVRLIEIMWELVH